MARKSASPAHAGIDLTPHRPHLGRSGLPRACGDRPHPAPGRAAQCAPPPRMRGSTLGIRVVGIRPVASPAHAGIDPPECPDRARYERLPRACGDRPITIGDYNGKGEPPPRMRGSTLSLPHWHKTPDASPAHAGIDPPQDASTGAGRGLPRACGDRPPVERFSAVPVLPPPRMRGSTPHLVVDRPCLVASPAHAGIDLRLASHHLIETGLPRACGDRPII